MLQEMSYSLNCYICYLISISYYFLSFISYLTLSLSELQSPLPRYIPSCYQFLSISYPKAVVKFALLFLSLWYSPCPLFFYAKHSQYWFLIPSVCCYFPTGNIQYSYNLPFYYNWSDNCPNSPYANMAPLNTSFISSNLVPPVIILSIFS